MNEELNNLIAILREELTQYGEVLALMQEQQELIINRAANELLINLNTVNSQMEQVAQVRQQRELARQQLVDSLGGTEETTFRQMTEMLPAEVQPLIDALVQEINQMLQNVQKWLRQNHILLKRSLDLMQTIMKSMFPSSSAVAGTYGRSGQVSPVNPPPSSLYEGII
ncbi:MAG: flagellar protein FlgN [Pedosphaera sp.]|nr:flagellar protein FlgN [Pedosphaera sp.]